jgi:DNA adenine methylase
VGQSTPFLRWVGGKRSLVPLLSRYLPSDWQDRRYVEPFLGAASLFFALRPDVALLNDANRSLIECYKQIKRQPKTVSVALKALLNRHSPDAYYEVRDEFNQRRPSAAQAARFIYLNHACFNGIFRVNMSGEFNVPFGRNPESAAPRASELRAVSRLLQGATLKSLDFNKLLLSCEETDFVYLDPPYPPLNSTAYFSQYTATSFSAVDQENVAIAFINLANLGAKVMVSNADTPTVRRLYRGFRIRSLDVMRYVSAKSVKHSVGEVIVTSY